jgi:GT2 family glycosyltransferase
VTVVVPTRNREARLAFALEALAAQTLDRERYEVVVVRSGDARGPFAEAPPGLRARFITHEGSPGPGTQRNAGVAAAAGRFVAFTDDDCRPAPNWLERLLAATRGESALVQGRTERDPDEAHLLVGLARSIDVNRPSDWYETCNILYPASVLERLGGFDERYRFSAEDADLGLRARLDGVERVYEPRAVVRHAVLPDPLPRAIASALARNSTPMLIAEHPEQRDALYGRVFWKRSHALLLLALTGAAVFGRRHRWAALVLALPYADQHVDWSLLARPRGAARVALNLGARIVVDLTEIAATAHGALRHRVLIL